MTAPSLVSSQSLPLTQRRQADVPAVMWFVLVQAARRYVIPAVVFPVALVVGLVGYHLEDLVSDKSTPSRPTSVAEERDERLLRESAGDPVVVSSVRQAPVASVLSRNLSPSLRRDN